MGTTAQKINYAINATNDIADGINNIGGNITQNTELADFKKELDKIYAELPKTNVIESDFIQIKETRKGKVLLTPKGNVEQETTKGINELSLANLNERTGNISLTKDIDGTITLNGTRSSGVDLYIFGGAGNYVSVNLNQGTNYLKLDTNDTNESFYVYVVKKASDETTTISVSNNNPQTSFEVNEGDTFRIFIRVFANKTLNDIFARIMVSTIQNADYEPYTGGIASPSPDYPQDVKVVTGNNNITVGGLNLLDNTKFVKVNPSQSVTPTFKDGKVIVNGTAGSGGADIRITNSTPFLTLKAGTYTFLFNEATTNWNCEINLTSLHLGTYKLIKGMNNNYRRFVVTFDSDFDIYNLNIHFRPNTTFTNQELWLMILEGDYSYSSLGLPDFEPYIEPIQKELNLGNIELAKVQDINLVNDNKLVPSTKIATVKNKLVTSEPITSSSSAGCLIEFPNFTPEVGDYYVSADIRLKSGTCDSLSNVQMWARGTWTASASWTRNPAISNEFQNYIRKYTISHAGDVSNLVYAFYVQVSNPNNAVLEFKNIQISKTNVDYIPYGTNSDLIFKNEIANPNYSSTLIKNAWYKLEKVAKTILNGTETWGKSGDIFYCSSIGGYARNNNVPYSNYFKGEVNKSSAGDTFEDNAIAFNISTSNNRLYIRADSIDGITTWLTEHNATIYYLKDNPTYTQITETALINQLEELNKIIGKGGTVVIETESESNNAPLIISASALASFENE